MRISDGERLWIVCLQEFCSSETRTETLEDTCINTTEAFGIHFRVEELQSQQIKKENQLVQITIRSSELRWDSLTKQVRHFEVIEQPSSAIVDISDHDDLCIT